MLAAKENRVKKVINSSSSAVYGDTLSLPQNEAMPVNPISPYALTKLTGEYYGNVFHRIYNLDTVSLRYFNVFGSRQDHLSPYSNAIPLFIHRVARNLPPIIYGDGKQSRDFVFVSDVIRANILATKKGIEGVYNIGSGIATTINELAEAIINIMQKEIKPIYQKPRIGDPKHTLADINRASKFGYKPEYSLQQGLHAIIPTYSSQINLDGN